MNEQCGDVLTADEREFVEAERRFAVKRFGDDASFDNIWLRVVDRLCAEVARLSRPVTQHCPLCEQAARDRDQADRAAVAWKKSCEIADEYERKAVAEMLRLATEVARLTLERDEARAEILVLQSDIGGEERIGEARAAGWHDALDDVESFVENVYLLDGGAFGLLRARYPRPNEETK